MEIIHTDQGTAQVMAIVGRLDASSAGEFKARCRDLLERGQTRLVISLEGTTFVDSSGLGVLVSILRQATQTGGDVRMAALPQEIKSLFELTRLNKAFDIYTDVPSAVASYA